MFYFIEKKYNLRFIFYIWDLYLGFIFGIYIWHFIFYNYIFIKYMAESNLDNNGGGGDLGKILLAIFSVIIILVLIFLAVQYFYHINIFEYIVYLIDTSEKESEYIQSEKSKKSTSGSGSGSSNKLEEIKYKKQVFNIPDNVYTYDNAKALCKAYNAELATYQQVESAYSNGAEWCNYGWSANQLALYPTQQKTYDKLQKIDGHKHDCGRPGVNGGYISNANIKFGVNCYGDKPEITNEEIDIMQNASPYPKTEKDIEFQKEVDSLKKNINSILVSPFNYNDWSTPI
jgi:hypothetical protein